MLLPNQKNYDRAYQLAYEIACEKLVKLGDIEDQCRKSGTQYRITDSQKEITIEYLNKSYTITLPEIEISRKDSGEKVSMRDKVLMLHYFLAATGAPVTGKLITFRELPEGNVYSPTFAKRTLEPIASYFGNKPHQLLMAGQTLGGYQVEYGDMAVNINAFSRVPITIILWKGDEEFPPQGNIVFDATISDYLATEDITVIGETITWKLIRYLKES